MRHQVTYYNNIQTKDIEKTTDIEKVFEFIHRKPPQKLIDLTQKIQTAQSEGNYEEKSRLKKSLPAITASGVFQEGHKKENLIKHSGLLQVDIDHPEIENFNEKYPDITLKNELILDPFIFALWYSPSGALKGLVKILPDASKHKQSYYQVEKYFSENYDIAIDQACKNINRLLFLSYTVYLHINNDAKTFQPLPEEKSKKKQQATYQVNGQNYGDKAINKAIDIIEKAGDGEKHPALVKASYLLGGYVGAGYITENSASEHLKYAIQGKENVKDVKAAYQTIHKCLSAGEAAPITVNDWKNVKKQTKAKKQDRSPTPETDQAGPPKKETKNQYNTGDNKLELQEIEDTQNVQEFEQENNFYIQNSSYFYIMRKVVDGVSKEYPVQLSNFCMKFLYRFEDGSNNVRRLIQLQSENETKVVEIETKELSLDKFKTAVRSHGFSIYGQNNRNWDFIFGYNINQEQQAIYINRLGYQAEHDIYAFSNAIITKNNEVKYVNDYGVVSDGENAFYLPYHSKLKENSQNYATLKQFAYKEGNISFPELFKIMDQAYGKKGLIGTIYGVLCLFRNIVFSQIGFFPIIYLYGNAGTGKTNFASFIQGWWGNQQKGIPVDSTPKGLSRTFSQTINALKYAKEYNEKAAKNQSLIALFKNMYDGDSYSSAAKTTDAETKEYPVEQGVFVDGNFLPNQEHALLTRMILLSFEKDIFSEQEKEAHDKLEKEAENGMGQIILELFKMRHEFQKYLKTGFNEIYESVVNARNNSTELLTRLQKHIALIIAGFDFLEKNVTLQYDRNEVVTELYKYIDEQNEMLNNIKPTTVFWQAIEYIVNNPGRNQNEILEHGKDYLLKIEQNSLFINFKEVLPKYNRYCINNNIQPQAPETLRKDLTSENYKPFRRNHNGEKQTLDWKIGKSYNYSVTIETGTRNYNITIGDVQITLNINKVNNVYRED